MKTKNDFGGVTVTDNHGSFGIGSDQTIINVNQAAVKELSAKLIEEIKSSDIPDTTKKDLKESINEVSKQVESGSPNKITLTGMLSGINAVISTINNSQSLIESFTKWKDCLMPFVGS
ncbi:hypothetical protein SPSIL_021730 [Sporomusa silvacetica DSM 10669]|uniref:Uncharacterized protein n=1 Tax=Sporomusa silvacetica DSM 10669 TaxID=1123289 RepID=A0ABZ3IK01_9FIRM|nr:hypothetical protein [Sporomusa silvacetica]OZC17283.1 hypothetical protein SPSIL_33000 [Sporomusa silvacetica DSM 10669]